MCASLKEGSIAAWALAKGAVQQNKFGPSKPGKMFFRYSTDVEEKVGWPSTAAEISVKCITEKGPSKPSVNLWFGPPR